MQQSLMNGILVTLGLIMAIGTQNAFVLSQALRREHHLVIALVCVLCDVVLISLGVFGLAQIFATHPILLAVARWGGVLFLGWYGLQALMRALRQQSLEQQQARAPKSLKVALLTTLAVTLLNPHVYLDTVLLIGALGAQQPSPIGYILGATLASGLWFFSLALLAAKLAPWLARPATWRVIDFIVALMMFAVAAQLIWGAGLEVASL
ncbi:LysE/ArgO family amino acid transporter [Thiopseudomonas alkaliphila]|uniref:LysE/ArgO family amino acid transporter n=1 Tax=Thiopseudomonas alkaliphila TaxID=1697053 RepID=UPI002576F63C|nr:LysE/ArgO family amino acid transporter [Thiopseudomonas alkaliphila]MDM1716518.1 amino acid transporter [Thiopseudomonas alkaliphila]